MRVQMRTMTTALFAAVPGVFCSTFTMMVLSLSPSSSLSFSSFWNDPTQVQSLLADAPSATFLQKIKEEPWRGGLEPIPVDGIPLHNVTIVEGKIPKDLQGMLCRNGPGRIRIGDTQYGHWFDGDGVISQLCLDGTTQRATFQASYVQTDRFQAQQAIHQTRGDVPMATAGAWTKRGRGKWWENLFAIPTNPSNTNVIFLDNKSDVGNGNDDTTTKRPRLFALAEGGYPVEIDTASLETIGTKAFQTADGKGRVDSFFSAHYKKDPITGHVYNHGVLLGPQPKVNVMKLTSSGKLLHQSTTKLPYLTFVHDSLISENYFVLLVQPYCCSSTSLLTSVLGGEPLGCQLEWNPDDNDSSTTPKTSLALVFSKDSLECMAQIPLPIVSSYHQIDAFEDPSSTNDDDGNETNNKNIITLRACIHDPPSSRTQLEEGFQDLYRSTKIPLCHFSEYVLDLNSQKMIRSRPLVPHAEPFELPIVNTAFAADGGRPEEDSCKYPKKRYVWTNTRTETASFLNALQKVDLETEECSKVVSFGDDVFAGNPIFVPKGNGHQKHEDNGYILSQLYRSDQHKSDICILDAASMKQVALLRLDYHITYQFHGEWCPGAFIV